MGLLSFVALLALIGYCGHLEPGDDAFEPLGLVIAPNSMLSLERGRALGWWSCMECDNWVEVVWAGTGYLVRPHPGGYEGPEDGVAHGPVLLRHR